MRNRYSNLRGFSLAEVAMAIALLAVAAVIFTPIIANSGTGSDSLKAQTELTTALTVLAAKAQDEGVVSAPTCTGTLTSTANGALTNRWNIANPCSLNDEPGSEIHFVGGNTSGNHSVSVATRLAPLQTGYGGAIDNWDTIVTAPVLNTSNGATVSCLAAVRSFPSGEEKYYEFPVPSNGCTAQTLEPLTTTTACTQNDGDRWATRCKP